MARILVCAGLIMAALPGLCQTLPPVPSAGAAGSPAAQPRATAPAPATKVIGRLGQAIKASTIHTSMSSRSRAYSRAKEFQYLVVNATRSPEWFSVVLVNGRNGFIRSDNVAKLPYEVTVPVSRPRNSTSRSSRGTRQAPVIQSGSTQVDQVLNQSFNYVGTPYKWGGNSLTGGIDCSGFVKELYEKIGVDLPRTAAQQARVGKPITRLEDLRAGDRLYFWERRRNTIGHTGIFLGYTADGGAYFIHSSSGRRGVATDDLRNAKWRNILVAARR